MPDFVSNGGILGIREQIGKRWSPSPGSPGSQHIFMCPSHHGWLGHYPHSCTRLTRLMRKLRILYPHLELISNTFKGLLWTQSFIEQGNPIARTPPPPLHSTLWGVPLLGRKSNQPSSHQNWVWMGYFLFGFCFKLYSCSYVWS